MATKRKRSYEGSAEDVADDKRQAKKRGLSMKRWEASSTDRRMDKLAAKSGKRGRSHAMEAK